MIFLFTALAALISSQLAGESVPQITNPVSPNTCSECYLLSVGESVRAWAGEDADLECAVRRRGTRDQGDTSIIWLRDTEKPGAEPEIIAHNDKVLFWKENKFLVDLTRSSHTTISRLTVS